MRGLCFVALLAGVACDSPDAPAPPASVPAVSATAAPASSPAKRDYPAPGWATIHDDTARGPTTSGLVPVTRTLVGQITTVDDVGLAVRFEGGPADDGQLDWSASLGKTTFVVTPPEGDAVSLTLAAPPKATDVSVVAARVHVIHVGPRGLRQYAGVTPWREKAPHLFAKPGRYRLRLSGELALGEREVHFETGEHGFEVVPLGRNALPMAERYGIASRFVAKVEGLVAPPKAIGSPVGDDDDNVVFRLRIGGGWLVDMAITPRGGLLGGRRLPERTVSKSEPWQDLFTRPHR